MIAALLLSILFVQPPSDKEYVNSIGMKMVRVPPGRFRMGATAGDYDEQPVHDVTLSYPMFVSQNEVILEEFQEFRMDFENVGAFSPSVTGVSWNDAVAFCQWLSKREGRPYRLPTEAEWEYAARGGGAGNFSSGNQPMGAGEQNAFGLKEMEAGAPEWVLDWYGPYSPDPQTDPVGPASGTSRVVRGGGIMGPYAKGPSGFTPYYRRDANRASLVPDFEGMHPVGFRVVQAALPTTAAAKVEPKPWQQFVKKQFNAVEWGPDPKKPWFRQRSLLPIPPENAEPEVIAAAGVDPGVFGHNHSPGIAVMPNGDVLVIEFSAPSSSTEYLPSTSFIAMRRRFGSDEWDMPSVFYDLADINDQSPMLWNDGGTIRFFGGGVGLAGVPFRAQASSDSGASWTLPQFPLLQGPVGGLSPQPITSALRKGREMFVATDAVGGESMLWVSDDDGRTWRDTLGRTGGRHTTFALLKDGSILGMGGKNTNIEGFMPKSISKDGGRTWEVSKTQFPALSSNQRPVLLRLASGRLFFASDWQSREGKQPTGISEHGAFAALSDDEGQTWKVRTLPGTLPHESYVLPQREGWSKKHHGYGTLGYTVAAQGPDELIHLITTMNHPAQEFELNEAWIESGGASTAVEDGLAEPSRSSQSFPDAKPQANWSGKRASSGRYVLDGLETWFYENGAKQYEVTWHDGLKVGHEAFWFEDGKKRWEWQHQPDGLGEWRQYWPNGNLKHVSHWRGGVCDGEAISYDPAGIPLARFQFANGELQ